MLKSVENDLRDKKQEQNKQRLFVTKSTITDLSGTSVWILNHGVKIFIKRKNWQCLCKYLFIFSTDSVHSNICPGVIPDTETCRISLTQTESFKRSSGPRAACLTQGLTHTFTLPVWKMAVRKTRESYFRCRKDRHNHTSGCWSLFVFGQNTLRVKENADFGYTSQNIRIFSAWTSFSSNRQLIH